MCVLKEQSKAVAVSRPMGHIVDYHTNDVGCKVRLRVTSQHKRQALHFWNIGQGAFVYLPDGATFEVHIQAPFPFAFCLSISEQVAAKNMLAFQPNVWYTLSRPQAQRKNFIAYRATTAPDSAGLSHVHAIHDDATGQVTVEFYKLTMERTKMASVKGVTAERKLKTDGFDDLPDQGSFARAGVALQGENKVDFQATKKKYKITQEASAISFWILTHSSDDPSERLVDSVTPINKTRFL